MTTGVGGMKLRAEKNCTSERYINVCQADNHPPDWVRLSLFDLAPAQAGGMGVKVLLS